VQAKAVTIKGNVNPQNSEIKINNEKVNAENGSFTYEAQLADYPIEKNQIMVEATNDNGKSSRQVIVTRIFTEDEKAEGIITNQAKKEETIQIILKFFHFWQTLTLYKDNLSDDESKKWESFTEAKRKSIVKRVRKEKLEKVKAEIESAEIKKICDDSERKELYRKDFLELVELLLLEIEK